MQNALFHESITDALQEVISTCGGPKKIGGILFPELPIDQAANKVRACLIPDRREKFSPEQVLFLAKLGRQNDCHAVMRFFAQECSYAEPVPIEPEAEAAKIAKDIAQAAKALEGMTGRLNSLQSQLAQLNTVRKVA